MEHAGINGLDIRYREYGPENGPLVFLLHGFGGGPMDFQEVIPHLSKVCKVVVPNLKVFFSHPDPLTYTGQVDVLEAFINQHTRGEQNFHLLAVSYGATLSLALKCRFKKRVESHTIVNPMPFDPLHRLRNQFLKVMLNFYHIPGGLSVFLKTPIGQKTLRALGKVFHMGLRGQDRLKYFNERKLHLIEKALKRFIWVANNENWKFWHHETKGRCACLALYSTKDSLFSADDYEKFLEHLGRCRTRPVSAKGHRLVVTHPDVVGKATLKNITKAVEKSKLSVVS